MHRNPQTERNQSYSHASPSLDAVSPASLDVTSKPSSSNSEPTTAARHRSKPTAALPLRFINFDHASRPSAGQHRKLIRSHVTTLQHQRQRGLEGKGGKSAVRTPIRGAGGTSGSVGARKRKKAGDLDEAEGEEPGEDEGQGRRTIQVQTDRSAREKRLEMYQQMAMGRVDPFRANDSTADWTVDIPSIIDQYLSRARFYIKSQGLADEARLLHPLLVKPRLYLDGFLYNALITLTTTRVAVTSTGRRCDPLVAWLRNNFLMTIRVAIEQGFDNRKVLAVGMALLIGWELDVGDPSTCDIHLKALPKVIADSATAASKATASKFDYGDANKVAIFRSGRRIPPGFEFYASQNLLPGTLMFHVGSLMYFDASAPGSSLWMRELWSSIGACAPVEEVASKAVAQRTIASRVAQLIRHAGIMLGSFMRLSAGERPVAQPLMTGIRALWHATLSDEWDSPIGTIYDEILLWCLCVFCSTSGYWDRHHVDAIRLLLASLDVGKLDRLVALLGRYLCPTCLYAPLTRLWFRGLGYSG